MGDELRVSRESLLTLGLTLRSFGEEVDDLDAITGTSGLDGSLPGSATQQALVDIGLRVEGAYLRVAERLRDMGELAEATADRYDRSDTDYAHNMSELAERMDGMGVQS